MISSHCHFRGRGGCEILGAIFVTLCPRFPNDSPIQDYGELLFFYALIDLKKYLASDNSFSRMMRCVIPFGFYLTMLLLLFKIFGESSCDDEDASLRKRSIKIAILRKGDDKKERKGEDIRNKDEGTS